MTTAGARNRRPTVPTWATPWIDSFRLYLQAAGRSPLTVDRYTDAASWLAGWLATERPKVDDWADVDHQHIQAWLVHLQAAGYSSKYVNNIGGAVQQFYAWYVAEEDAPNPFERVKVPAAPKLGEKPPPVIATDQLAKLIRDAESKRDFESRRDAALLRIFAATGARLAEVADLCLDDLNVAGREATVTGKGGKVRTVKFEAKAALALDRYLRVRSKHRWAALPQLWLAVRVASTSPGGMTPSGVRQVIQRRGERLGIQVHPHLFRHTFAHRWLDAGGAEGDLQELAGWDSAQMLRHYGRSARSARARRAYDRVDVMGGV